jgi:hypothetical protein
LNEQKLSVWRLLRNPFFPVSVITVDDDYDDDNEGDDDEDDGDDAGDDGGDDVMMVMMM